MKYLLAIAPYGAYAVALYQLVKFIYRRIRPWIKTSEEKARSTAKIRRQSASFFSALVIASTTTFCLLLLLAVSSLTPQSRLLLLLGGGTTALALLGLLLHVVGVPAYNCVMDLEDRSQRIEDRCKIYEDQLVDLDHRNQSLNNRCRSLEDRNQRLEERGQKLEARLKAIEFQAQKALPEEQSPTQRKLAFMDMWSVQRRDQDNELIKQTRSDAGRNVG